MLGAVPVGNGMTEYYAKAPLRVTLKKTGRHDAGPHWIRPSA